MTQQKEENVFRALLRLLKRWQVFLHGDGDNSAMKKVWWMLTDTHKKRLKDKMLHPSNVNCVAFSRDGTRLITGCDDAKTRIWSMKTGKVLMTLGLHSRGVECVSVAPNNSFFVTSADDHTMRMWSMETGRCIKKFEHKERVKCLKVSPDSKYIMAGYNDSLVRIWSILRGIVTCVLEGLANSITSVAISSDATFAVATSHSLPVDHQYVGETAVIFSMETGKVIRTLGTNNMAWDCMIVSPDNKFVVTGYRWGYKGKVFIWSVGTGDLVKCYENIEVVSLAYSSDGKILAMVDNSNVIRLVSSQTGSFIKIRGIQHRRSYPHIEDIAFSPNKYALACAG